MYFEIIVVLYGTIQTDLPELPVNAILTLSDYSEVYVPIIWDGEIDVYTMGTQNINGMLDLSDFEHMISNDLITIIQVVEVH